MEDMFEKPATPRVIDFAEAFGVIHWRDNEGKMHEDLEDDRPSSVRGDRLQVVMKGVPAGGVVLTDKQIRARRRRQIKKHRRLTDEQWELGYKPLEEWDLEELARGRPRNAVGDFRGRPPQYMTRELHERAVERFKKTVREDMNAHTVTALETIRMILTSEEIDEKGKPLVAAGTKLDAAKFLLEHVVGKAVQPTTSDISVKLQGILGAVMVNPAELSGSEMSDTMNGYRPAHIGTRGEIEMSAGEDGVFVSDDEDEDDEDA